VITLRDKIHTLNSFSCCAAPSSSFFSINVNKIRKRSVLPFHLSVHEHLNYLQLSIIILFIFLTRTCVTTLQEKIHGLIFVHKPTASFFRITEWKYLFFELVIRPHRSMYTKITAQYIRACVKTNNKRCTLE